MCRLVDGGIGRANGSGCSLWICDLVLEDAQIILGPQLSLP